MEDASKALWLAVGAILFIVAVTITIIMYSNMINTVNNTISINNIKTNIIENQGFIENIVYDQSQLYYMLQGVYENFAKGVNTEIYSSSLKIYGNNIYSKENVQTVIGFITPGTYNVEYVYEYVDSGLENMNQHKILEIKITKIS